MSGIKKYSPILLFSLFALALLFLVGCAAHHAELEQVRSEYADAAQTPNVMEYAPVHMEEAQTAIDKAAHEGDDSERDHYIYVAKKHIEIARSDAEKRASENELTDLQKSRERILVNARTQEADRANRRANVAEERAKEQESIAESSRRQADEAMRDSDRLSNRAAQLEQEVADLKAKETNRGLEMTVQGALFETGKADLKPGAVREIEKIARVLNEHPERQALIEGHTDASGSEQFNLELSRRRAESVANALEEHGVPASRIVARGYGKNYPVATNKTESGRQQNRRVNVVLLEQGKNPQSEIKETP